MPLPSLAAEPPHPSRAAHLLADHRTECGAAPPSSSSPLRGHDVVAALLAGECTSLYFEYTAEPPQPGEDPWAEADACAALARSRPPGSVAAPILMSILIEDRS